MSHRPKQDFSDLEGGAYSKFGILLAHIKAHSAGERECAVVRAPVLPIEETRPAEEAQTQIRHYHRENNRRPIISILHHSEVLLVRIEDRQTILEQIRVGEALVPSVDPFRPSGRITLYITRREAWQGALSAWRAHIAQARERPYGSELNARLWEWVKLKPPQQRRKDEYVCNKGEICLSARNAIIGRRLGRSFTIWVGLARARKLSATSQVGTYPGEKLGRAEVQRSGAVGRL